MNAQLTHAHQAIVGHGLRALLRAEEQLGRGDSGTKAIALETLDVTLANDEKALVFPLVDESRPLTERIQALERHFDVPQLDRSQRLHELIIDTTTWAHPWTRACAIYTVGKLKLTALTECIEDAQTSSSSIVYETASWALSSLH